MGLGSAPDIQSVYGCPSGSIPLPVFPQENAPGSRAVRSELVNAVGAACRGRLSGAQQAINGAKYFLKQVPAAYQGFWSAEIAKASAYVSLSARGAEARRRDQEDRESSYGKALVDYAKNYREPCGVTDVSCHLERLGEWARANWWKAALGVGGVVAIYGLSTGVGSGFAAKRL